MKQLFINRLTGTTHTRKLCKPIGYSNRQEAVYTKVFPGGQNTIVVRPFCVESDFTFAYEWICRTYTPGNRQHFGPAEQWIDTYTMMLQSDFAQPFVVLLNDTPVCLADVYYGQFHELSLYTEMQQEDYVIEVLAGPLKKKERTVLPLLLQTCLHYMYSFTEVNRVVSEPNTWDAALNTAMQKSGFQLIGKIEMCYKTANLYESHKASFLQHFP